MDNDPFWRHAGERVFAVPGVRVGSDPRLAAAITNGTAPGLYVREGDDTSDWETYRQVLARRVEEAVAARRGGASGDETATVAVSPQIRECHWCHNSRRITHSQDDEDRVCSYCFDWPEVAQAREDAAALAAARAMPTATTRQDDEIRVGDVVEVVSCSDIHYTRRSDIGGGGRITQRGDNSVQLAPVDSMRLPRGGIAAIADVRKVSSSPSPQAVASPMPDEEAARIEAAVSDEVRRRISSPLASSSDETTIRPVVNPVPPTAGVYIGPATIRFDDRAFTGTITATGHLRRGELPVSSLPTAASPPSPPSRFSLLEVDGDTYTDTAPAPTPQATRASTGLAALQNELRAEREAKRALAAEQTPPGRFDLIECDLPAVPVAPVVAIKSPQSSSRPAASSPPPRRPVETITDLTTARSPLELARMLEGLNDELSTMMRRREAN